MFLLWGDDQLFDRGSVIRSGRALSLVFRHRLGVRSASSRRPITWLSSLASLFGTLVLTLSIVIIEVVLIGAVALGGKALPTLGRDTMFAVLMIVLNGVVGLSLLLGGVRHHEQS